MSFRDFVKSRGAAPARAEAAPAPRRRPGGAAAPARGGEAVATRTFGRSAPRNGARARARAENAKKLGGKVFVGTPGDVAAHESMAKLLARVAEHVPLPPGRPRPLAGFEAPAHARLNALRRATALLVGPDALEAAEASERGLGIFCEAASTALNFLAALLESDHPLRYGLGTRFSLPALTRQHAEAVALATARRVVVRMHDNGFFGNFLQLLDALVHCPASCAIAVDWRTDGHEGHFTYGSENVGARAGKERDMPNFKGSSLGRLPLVSADFWTSDHLSKRSRSVDAFFETIARGTLTLKRG